MPQSNRGGQAANSRRVAQHRGGCRVPRESRASKTWFWRSTHTPILGWSFGASFLARDQKVVLTSRDREGLPPRATLNLMDPSQTVYWTRTYRDDFQASSKPSRPTFVRVYTENNF